MYKAKTFSRLFYKVCGHSSTLHWNGKWNNSQYRHKRRRISSKCENCSSRKKNDFPYKFPPSNACRYKNFIKTAQNWYSTKKKMLNGKCVWRQELMAWVDRRQPNFHKISAGIPLLIDSIIITFSCSRFWLENNTYLYFNTNKLSHITHVMSIALIHERWNLQVNVDSKQQFSLQFYLFPKVCWE